MIFSMYSAKKRLKSLKMKNSCLTLYNMCLYKEIITPINLLHSVLHSWVKSSLILCRKFASGSFPVGIATHHPYNSNSNKENLLQNPLHWSVQSGKKKSSYRSFSWQKLKILVRQNKQFKDCIGPGKFWRKFFHYFQTFHRRTTINNYQTAQ